MKLLLRFPILIIALVILVYGCTETRTDQPSRETLQAQSLVKELQTQLENSRQDSSRRHDQNQELIEKVRSLMERLKEQEAKLKEKEKEIEADRESRKTVGEERKESAGASDVTDPARIGLMGAKALAEFRAKELSGRLDVLSKDLEAKERELQTIRENAARKETEVRQLTEQMQELNAGAEARQKELGERLEKIAAELKAREAAGNKMQQELNEKAELLDALKYAVSDAGRLKTGAEKAAEQLNAELQETQKQLTEARAHGEELGKQLAQLRSQFEQTTKQMKELDGQGQQLYAHYEQVWKSDEQNRTLAAELKAQLERSQQEAQQYHSEADRGREEVVRYRVEAERQRKVAEELKSHCAEVATRLQQLEAAQKAHDPNRPSNLDRILQGPTAESQPAPPASSLY